MRCSSTSRLRSQQSIGWVISSDDKASSLPSLESAITGGIDGARRQLKASGCSGSWSVCPPAPRPLLHITLFDAWPPFARSDSGTCTSEGSCDGSCDSSCVCDESCNSGCDGNCDSDCSVFGGNCDGSCDSDCDGDCVDGCDHDCDGSCDHDCDTCNSMSYSDCDSDCTSGCADCPSGSYGSSDSHNSDGTITSNTCASCTVCSDVESSSRISPY